MINFVAKLPLAARNQLSVVPEGQFARKQLRCPWKVISWSHGSRFRQACKLVGSDPTGRLLDYGCGDGTFLGMVADRFAECWGADIAADQIEDCRARLSAISNVRFCPSAELSATLSHCFATVTCMETLEHCVEPVVEKVLEDLQRLCALDGKVIISVPIEIGPTFLLKYAIRSAAGWRGLSDYRYYERYSVADAVRSVFATENTVIARPMYGDPGAQTHSHYGFNWRRLRCRVAQWFSIESTSFSPLGVLGGWFSSQVWFVCRQKEMARLAHD